MPMVVKKWKKAAGNIQVKERVVLLSHTFLLSAVHCLSRYNLQLVTEEDRSL